VTERVFSNRERYNRMARAYEALVRFGSLGQLERFYRTVAGELEARPGGTILDLGRGPGMLVPHLLPNVAPRGAVIVVDVADRLNAPEHARTR
jgi:ubiquinone/menaquinone biosynthesis C-methylase UbiE